MLGGDYLRVGDRIIEKLHHFFAVSWVIFYFLDAIVFSVTIIVGSTARAYFKNIRMNFWKLLASSGFSYGKLSIGCASWGAVDL